MRNLSLALISVTIAVAAVSACGGDEGGGGSGGATSGGSSGATTGGSSGATTGGSSGATTGGSSGATTGGTGGADAGGEYLDDAGVCRTDETFTADCPATLDVAALCTICASQHQKDCGNITQYANWCTPSRSCWYDASTKQLVGAQYCGDTNSHCGDKANCVSWGNTPACVDVAADLCQSDAGAD